MVALDNDILTAVAKFFSTGDGTWLLEAIRRCAQYRKPIPDILRQPYDDALRRYNSGAARTLDEAFNVSRAKGWNQQKHRLMYRKGWAIYQEVLTAHDAKVPIDLELFESIGKRHHVSGSTARNYYRDVKRSMKRMEAELNNATF